jgi:L-iditol 2-dehydrogenase
VRALRVHAAGDLRVDEVPPPEPGEGDVVVEVEVALTGSAERRALEIGSGSLDGSPAPLGRELAGVDTRNGRRVVAASSAPCGHCPLCLADREALCRRPVRLVGAFAERVLVPARIAQVNLHPVPRDLHPAVAALVDPLACCLHASERAGLAPGNLVAVLGSGPIGLMLCACVADAGARPVIVGGRPERRALAPLFGAVPGDGRGADVVLEAAGTEQAWRDAVGLVRPGGTVLFFGGREVAVDTYRLHYEELTLRGAFHHTPRSVRAALAFLASGARPWERLLTHEVSLDGVPGLFADPPTGLLKAAVRP